MVEPSGDLGLYTHILSHVEPTRAHRKKIHALCCLRRLTIWFDLSGRDCDSLSFVLPAICSEMLVLNTYPGSVKDGYTLIALITVGASRIGHDLFHHGRSICEDESIRLCVWPERALFPATI